MPRDRFGETWPAATYNGFSGPDHARPQRSSRRLSRGAVVGGAACAAVALGLAAGFALRPDHRALAGGDQPQSGGQHMPIEVSAPAPAPAAQPAGKLEVLNPATAETARAAQPLAPQPVIATAPAVLAAPQPAPLTSAPAPRAFSCASHSRAEALICADPELAAYDRELNGAYRRALRSGAVAPEDLRADQRDWLDDRERAAGRSPEALAEAYQDRIDELNRIADDGPGDDSGD